MLGLRRSAWLLLLMAIAAYFGTGCASVSRYRQCQQVVEIANEAGDRARELTDSGQTQDSQAMLQAADTLEDAAERLATLELKEEELDKYRQGFVEMYRGTSQATREFVKAKEAKDRAAAEAAKEELSQVTASEKQLVAGVNEYCLAE